ncbi:bifunctional 4-hydroxy-2-oxoglutarate aldolase/2-dehydro-3-deoxy-phosphogluconate aldolase [Streptomyces composti]|nr:bifunctional 4-hydroxy-2-oxoglutarate aldolase/2-dehydro-3-deoxy-phosphogluconate aldolase [Streptomyces composti]
MDSLRAGRLLAIVRGTAPESALRTVIALAEEGIEVVEISLTSTDALHVIAQARAELGPKSLVGAGTVRTAADAVRAIEAGASYLVTPGLVDGLSSSRLDEVPVLMGALTPSEIESAVARGACAVKLFPASATGPSYLKALRGPFPDVPFVPVGGVDAARARAYLSEGAVAVGVGSPLIGDAADGGDLSELRRRAAQFRTATEGRCR